MAELFPRIEPYDHGWLPVGQDNEIYWETSGNPAGRPAVVVHGGPGSGATAGWRRYFDPSRYRIILFDQRGCGRSRPSALDPAVSLEHNTTAHLIADLEHLRAHLGAARWLLLGASWGATLSIAYAEEHPDAVAAIVLMAVTNTTPGEVAWLTRDIGRLFPAEWERFAAGVPTAERDGNLAAAYARLLASPDPDVRFAAARDWCAWEDALVKVHPGSRANPRYDDPDFRYLFARIVTHYLAHAAFIPDGQLLARADRLAGIPGVLAHGRLDVGSPLVTAWRLAQAWPDAELVIGEDEGHGFRDPSVLVEAVARMATAGRW